MRVKESSSKMRSRESRTSETPPRQELDDDVERVNWFSTYRADHRVADHFRKGGAFLLGDAPHIHSPVSGQGMNTGIGDV
jgi:2-polyprenyl-6-methoxyphenol hydroxylase-like FAD-dependent oxidoreductase